MGSYTYNALGERIQKTAGTTTRFIYDDDQHLLTAEATGSNTRDYVWLDELPVAVIDSVNGSARAIDYVTADALGTPRAISNTTSVTVWQWSSTGNAWGEATPGSNGYVFNLRYLGQYFDAESGLVDNINRTYDPTTGRYIQSDPMGLPADISTYAYVGNNPLNGTDPLGLDALVIAGGHISGSPNIFGHVANAVTGAGVFSYGNDTSLGSGVQAYIQSQLVQRNQAVTYIPTSPQQDAQMIAYYAMHPGGNSVGIFDNCAARTNQALNAGNVPTQDIPFPGGLSRDVGGLPGAQQFFIPQGGPIPQGLLNLLPGFERHE